jgi:hypothetical protein
MPKTKGQLKDPLNRHQKQQVMDEIIKRTNIAVLKREVFNDSIQLPLKYFAYIQAPSMR